jgi:hypothetical protein
MMIPTAEDFLIMDVDQCEAWHSLIMKEGSDIDRKHLQRNLIECHRLALEELQRRGAA